MVAVPIILYVRGLSLRKPMEEDDWKVPTHVGI